MTRLPNSHFSTHLQHTSEFISNCCSLSFTVVSGSDTYLTYSIYSYSLDAAHASLGAENYDQTVYRFLRNMMKRKDARDTYIVLRSDHGLQGELFDLHPRFWRTAYLMITVAPLIL